MLISLKEYSLKNGKHPDTARQRAGRGSFKTAVKIGRDWLIDSDEPWPRDLRIKNTVVYYDEKKDFTRFNDCAEKALLAISRLENPYNLSDEDYVMYQDWLFDKAGDIAKEFVDLGKPGIFPSLLKYRVIKRQNINKLVEYAQSEGKFDMLSALLNVSNILRDKKFSGAKRKKPGNINPSRQEFPGYQSSVSGDTVWLGKAPIPWTVLEKKDGCLTLLSKFALECQPYNQVYHTVTWADCSLRRWLNREFIHGVFSEDEKDRLCTVYIGEDDRIYSQQTDGCTRDRVYLLSMAEARDFFKTPEERRARVTVKAKSKIMWASFDVFGHWWLRSPSTDKVGGSYVRDDGEITDHGGVILSNSYDKYFDHYGVRPVIRFRCD